MSPDTATRVRDALEAKADALEAQVGSQTESRDPAGSATTREASGARGFRERLAPLAAAIVVAGTVGGITTWLAINHDHATHPTGNPAATANPAPTTNDYACRALSIEVVSSDGVVTPVAISGDVAQRVSIAAPAHVVAHIQPGCRASATLTNDPIPDGVDVQTQVVTPVARNEWMLERQGRFRLTAAVGMCDLGPTREPQCIGGLAMLATVIITVRQ